MRVAVGDAPPTAAAAAAGAVVVPSSTFGAGKYLSLGGSSFLITSGSRDGPRAWIRTPGNTSVWNVRSSRSIAGRYRWLGSPSKPDNRVASAPLFDIEFIANQPTAVSAVGNRLLSAAAARFCVCLRASAAGTPRSSVQG